MISYRFRLAALALLFVPTVGHAQLGGLKRKLGDQLAKAVGGESQSNAAPTFNERVLEITDARLSQLVKGLQAESVQAERERRAQAADDAKQAAYDKKAEAYAKCTDPYTEQLLRYTGMTMGLAVAAKREEGKANGQAIKDSLNAVLGRVTKLKNEMTAKCGEGPGDSPFAAMGEGNSVDPEELGAKAAGLSAEQYGVLRERVAAYLSAQGKSAGRYAFTANERAAIDRAASALAGVKKTLLGD